MGKIQILIRVFLLFMIAFNFTLRVYAQGDFSFLDKELAKYKSSDTVIVFGIFNNSGNYVISTFTNSRFIKYKYKKGEYVRVFDSSANCKRCNAMNDFVKNNFDPILSNLDSGYYFSQRTRIENGDTFYIVTSEYMDAYFVGMYHSNKLRYTFIEKARNINEILERKGYYYWMYLNLLRNQWNDYIDDFSR